MAKKRARKGRARPLSPAISRAREIFGPTRERRCRGPVERLDRPIADLDGRPARPFRSVDTLAVMERRGSITREMRAAGDRFREYFATAHLNPLRAANLFRTSRGNNAEIPGFKIDHAKDAVWRALLFVGGLASPGGSCLWHVVGAERTLKEWALEQGWAGRRVGQEAASGILIVALGILEARWG